MANFGRFVYLVTILVSDPLNAIYHKAQFRNPSLSARKVINRHKMNAIVGEIIHIRKNFLTSVFLKIFFEPNLATPIPKIAATFN